MEELVPSDGALDMAAWMMNQSPEMVDEDAFISEAVRIERMLGKTDEVGIALRLLRGWHLDNLLSSDRAETYGENRVERFSRRIQEETGMSIGRSTLYEERMVYRKVRKKMIVRVRSPYENLTTPRQDEQAVWEAFWNWYRGERSDLGERVYWTHVKRWATDDEKDQAKIYGSKEDAKRKALNKLESGMIDLANYVEAHGEDDEIVGVLLQTKDTLSSYYELEEVGPRKRIQVVEEDDYHDWLTEHICVITGADPEAVTVDPAHLWSGIMGGKTPWLCAVPLEHELHAELHNIGTESFTKKYGAVFGLDEVPWYRILFNLYYEYQYGETFDLDFSF